MVLKQNQIIESVLSLPPKDRAQIIDQLIARLDQPDETIDELWKKEVQHRIQAYRDGKLKKVSLKEVLAKHQTP